MEETEDSNTTTRNLTPQNSRHRERIHHHHHHHHNHHNYHHHQHQYHNINHPILPYNNYHYNNNNLFHLHHFNNRLIGFFDQNSHHQQQQRHQGILPLPPILPFQEPFQQNQKFRAKKTHFSKPHNKPTSHLLPTSSHNATMVSVSPSLQGKY